MYGHLVQFKGWLMACNLSTGPGNRFLPAESECHMGAGGHQPRGMAFPLQMTCSFQTQWRKRLGYVRNPRSLMEGTETLCRDDIGNLPGSPMSSRHNS